MLDIFTVSYSNQDRFPQKPLLVATSLLLAYASFSIEIEGFATNRLTL